MIYQEVCCLTEVVLEEPKTKPKKMTRIVASGNKKPEKQSKKGKYSPKKQSIIKVRTSNLK